MKGTLLSLDGTALPKLKKKEEKKFIKK